MSADPSLIADLIRAGVDADLVQRVALELGRASAEREAIEKRRQADRERQARRRGHVMSRDVTLQTVTARDVTAAPNGPSPLPPQTPPITPTPNTTSDPDGSASPSGEPRSAEIIDPRKDLFDRGLGAIRRMTGCAEPRCRTLLGKWLRDAGDSAVVVMAAIDTTEAAETANPIPYVEAIIAREAKRNGSGSHDTFGRGAAGNRHGGSSFDAVASGLARVAARRGLGSGSRANGGGPGHATDHDPRRDDPSIEDADWTSADGDRPAHRRPAGRH
ncbi:hypothetical protein [Methylorubrum extorquens]|uniref:hypothetical protein n=1 Tax=Methylorubrum extorquens TaxID=408 RepID=UPI0012DB1781|nr:hypothetical protein [Methylorubrum extorquens]